MKFIPFIKWHLRKISLDMALWITFCFSCSFYVNTLNDTFFYIAASIFVYGLAKFTWYLTKESYKTFEKEQQGLLDKIKHSDVK